MTAEEIARMLAGKLHGEGSREIRGVAGLETAGPGELTYAESARALQHAASARAGVILVPEGVTLQGQTTVAVAHPKLAFIRAADALRPSAVHPAGIHPTAVIASDVEVPGDAGVGAYVVIERAVKIGAGTRLSAGVYLGEGVQVGAHCVLHPRVTLYSGAQIGNRVVLHAGVVVGSDGFGYVFGEGRHHKFPQLGKVIIEDDVEIGSNSTIDRGSLGSTTIGQGTKIDNLCQIAHNVKIGRHCIIAAQTGISGSVEIGNNVVLGGQVGIADHVRIEDNVMIGGRGAVFPGKVIRKGNVVWGDPVRPLAEYKKLNAYLSRLPGLVEKVRKLSQRLARQDD
jgi:UDP-3-O-[3-hydroxymyristoyl] glucosamine N-acyltransferase